MNHHLSPPPCAALALLGLLLGAPLVARAQGATDAVEASRTEPGDAALRSPEPDSDTDSEAVPEPESGAPAAEAHRHAVFVYPYAWFRRGFVAGYEYAVPHTRLGLVAEYSFERRARGDFRSTASGVGLGWRFYFLGRSRFGRFAGPACVGLFIGGMGSLRVAGVRQAEGRDVYGRATRLTGEGQLGYRFPIRARAELSTILTAGLNVDFVGGLALQLRPSVGFGLTFGILL